MIWLITIGEPIPLLGTRHRLLRTGLLAEALAAAGQPATWWTSTFDHSSKHLLPVEGDRHALPNGTVLQFLHGMPYDRNVSLRRMLNHMQLGREFRRRAAREPAPRLIVCSFPTIELSVEAVRYGRKRGIPVLLDVRDLWPDLIFDAMPAVSRPATRLLLSHLSRQTREAFEGCTGIIGISQGYLDWGLAQAGRPRGSADAMIPLGYQPRPRDPQAQAAAGRALAELGVDVSARILWFIGSFGQTYDLGPVIEAARVLAFEGMQAVQVVISGSGERGTEWRRLAYGVANVVFTGWLDADQIDWMLDHSYAGLAAYRAGAPQGLPNKLLEYLAGGLPVLSGLQGEAATLLHTHACGWSYNPAVASSLLPPLRLLLRDPVLRARAGINARRLFEERFSPDAAGSVLTKHVLQMAGLAASAADAP